MVEERERYFAHVMRRRGVDSLESLRFFEAGCAGGYNLRMFVQLGARPENVVGMDLDGASVDHCRARASDIIVHHGSADSIPEDAATFDISIAYTLFSSVPTETISEGIAHELVRITKPGGLILIYDMRRRSPRNPAVHPISREDIERWFAGHAMGSRSLTLAPPAARVLGRWAPGLYGLFAAVPFLRTHAFYVIRRSR
jgi:SAM-dependent methyltransferase